jgi:hypothetical protein
MAQTKPYPCPCGRGAELVPIFLTEAFGCDRCPKMFVLHGDGRLEEQITMGYTHARIWRWTGMQWRIVYPKQRQSAIVRSLAALVMLIVGWLLFGRWLAQPFAGLYWFIGILGITFGLPLLNDYWETRR